MAAQEINLIYQPRTIELKLADPNTVGPAGASVVSASVTSGNDLQLVMSDARVITVQGFKFAAGNQSIENTLPAEALSALRIVARAGNSIVYADSNVLNTAFTVLGITLTSGTGSLHILRDGTVEDSSFNFTPLQPLFLNTLGFFSHTHVSTGFSIQVGTALTQTKMMVAIGIPIIL